MNSKNSKTSKPHILKLKLTNKLDLRLGEKIIALSNLSIHYTWKNIKSSYNNNKFKISSDIQDYFEYIWEKHGENIDDPSGQIYVNKIKNSTTFKIKSGYSRELLTTETMKLFGSTENKITKDKTVKMYQNLKLLK